MNAHPSLANPAHSATYATHDRSALLLTADTRLAQQLIKELARLEQAERLEFRRPRHFRLPIAANLEQARTSILRTVPAVILLDAPAGSGNTRLDSMLCELAASAPLVVIVEGPEVGESPQQNNADSDEPAAGGAGDRNSVLHLVSSGRVVLVPRKGDFVALAALLIACRMGPFGGCGADSTALLPPADDELRSVNDFESGRANPANRQQPPEERGILLRSPEGERATVQGEEFGEILRHEMNNPLTGILGNAELLLARRKELPSAVIARLETIAALAVRLRETIRRLSTPRDDRHVRQPNG